MPLPVLSLTDKLLALTPMRGNVIGAAVVLLVGVVALRLFRRFGTGPTPRRPLVLAALLGGPALAILLFAADVFWISPDIYLQTDDYFSTLWRYLAVGTACGIAAAGAIGISLKKGVS